MVALIASPLILIMLYGGSMLREMLMVLVDEFGDPFDESDMKEKLL